MCPLLHSLTANISADSVIATTAGLCVLHLALHDYKCVSCSLACICCTWPCTTTSACHVPLLASDDTTFTTHATSPLKQHAVRLPHATQLCQQRH